MWPHDDMHKKFAQQRTYTIEQKLFRRGLILNQYRPRFFVQPTLLDSMRYARSLLSIKRLRLKRRTR
jgi:hypothetical protein